jgi:hypothetical protein
LEEEEEEEEWREGARINEAASIYALSDSLCR